MSNLKQCLNCKKYFKKPYTESRKKWETKHIYCSRKCHYSDLGFRQRMSESQKRIWQSETRKAIVVWNKGKKLPYPVWNKGLKTGIVPKTAFKKLDPRIINENHYLWKGDQVGYSAIHGWIIRRLGKPTKCEHCGRDGLSGNEIHWANKSQEYKRDLSDWLRLCKECHEKYDKETKAKKVKDYLKNFRYARSGGRKD